MCGFCFQTHSHLTSHPVSGLTSEHVEEDLENVKNPLEDVKAGLLDSSGQQLPLQAVHVKCKLMDLLSQVGKRSTWISLVTR